MPLADRQPTDLTDSLDFLFDLSLRIVDTEGVGTERRARLAGRGILAPTVAELANAVRAIRFVRSLSDRPGVGVMDSIPRSGGSFRVATRFEVGGLFGVGGTAWPLHPYSRAWFCVKCGAIWARGIADGARLWTITYCTCEAHGGGSLLHDPVVEWLPGNLLLRELALSETEPFPTDD